MSQAASALGPNLDPRDRPARQRVFLAALAHETNSFSPLPTTLRSFAQGTLHRRGDAATLPRARQFPGYADVLEIAAERGDECLDGFCAWAEPAGPLSRRDHEALQRELLADLEAALPVDFVFLVLHGAMVAEGCTDCEGELLQRVRQRVGPGVPVGALLDLHGNLSEAMVDSGAVLVACKEYPHTDYPERARELYSMLAQAARTRTLPGTTVCRVPMLALLGTTEPPVRDFVRGLQDGERLPGVLSVSAMHGFAWSDTPHTGAAILVVHRDDPAAAAAAGRLAARLAAQMYALRETAQGRRLALDAALDAALAAAARAQPGRPVVLADSADNPGGGAACDSTFVLRALLERGATGVALGMVWDPQAVAIATDAGVGARLPLRIGGKVGPMSGDPVDLVVEVLACRDDAVQRALGGLTQPLGAAVAVRASGIDLVLNSARQQVFSPDCFTALGVALQDKRLLVVKSTQHFRAGFDAIAGATVYCDAPGSLNGDLAALPYRHLRRPLWPLDPDAAAQVGFQQGPTFPGARSPLPASGVRA